MEFDYKEMVEQANSHKTPFRIYCLDGSGKERVNAEREQQFKIKTLELLLEMKNAFLFLEKKLNKKILIEDEVVKLSENIEDLINDSGDFICYSNPNFTAGDMASFYLYNIINLNDFISIFNKCAKKVGNNFTYHLSYSNYDTNDYTLGAEMLWVGDAQKFLKENKNTRSFDLNAENFIEIEEIL